MLSRIYLLVLILLMAPMAYGQTSDGGGLGNIAIDDFADMMQAMKVTGDSYSTIFIGEGADLAKVFFFITLAWLLFKLVISDTHPMVRGEVLAHFTKAVVVFVMLTNWVVPQTVASLGTFGDIRSPVSVKGLFVDSFNELQAPIFAKAGMDKGTVVKAVGATWATFWQASDKRGEIRGAARARAKGMSVFAWLTDSVSLTMDAIADKVITFVVSIGVALLAIGLMGAYLFVIYWGDILAIVGMVMGPLMVPCLLFKKTEQIFDSWLKFIIQGGFYKLIAALLAVLTLGTINTIQTQVNAMYAKATLNDGSLAGAIGNQTLFAGGFILSLVMTVLYMVFGIALMLKVSDLTKSLMNGQFGDGAKAVGQAGEQTAQVVSGK